MKKVIMLVIGFMLTVGCTLIDLTPPKTSAKILSDNTCDKPCVLGITPGLTTQSQSWTSVNSSPWLSGCELQDLSSQGGGQWIACNSKSFEIAFPDSNVVSWIRISTSNFSVKQLVQMYGPPDAIGVLHGPLPDEPVYSTAILVYDRIQAEIYLIEKSGSEYEVTPDTQVDAILFKSEQEHEKDAASFSGAWAGYTTYSP